MKCPVCEKRMDSMVCGCGYDASRDYEQYPAFGRIPEGMASVAGLRSRMNHLIRCPECGFHGFSLDHQKGKLCCLQCGRALTAQELKPLTDAMGLGKTEKPAAQNPEKKEPAVKEEPRSNSADGQNPPNRIVSIAAGYHHTVALYADGTVAAIGSNSEGECNVSSWRDIIAITAGSEHTAGLKKDGTVVIAGYSYGTRKKVQQWQNITAIADGTFNTVGVKKDGTVVAEGDNGKAVSGVSDWNNILAVAAGRHHTIALDRFGKVFVAGKGPGTKLPWNGWDGVVAIAAGREHSAALTRDGRVLLAGAHGDSKELGTSNVEIAAGFDFTVVQKKDGTAAISGSSSYGKDRVKNWTDLEKIAANWGHVVGLKKDGTLVAAGKNDKGQCNVHKLMRK